MSIKLFEQKEVRSVWNEDQEKWYFSIVDVVEILTESIDPSAYWRKLKQRLKAEGNETVTNCHGLKMRSHDGKMPNDRCCRCATAVTSYSVNTITESRAI